MVRRSRLTGGLALALVVCAGSVQAQTPRYQEAIEAELQRMGIESTCEAEGTVRVRCGFRHVTRDGERELWLRLTYSDETDTLYVHVPRLIVAAPEDETTPIVLRRLAELNWRMLATKLEWNPSNGEVRISGVLHTDSNFDRRAFRTLVRVVLSQAERYQPELERLLSSLD